jgi:hypothetical protein
VAFIKPLQDFVLILPYVLYLVTVDMLVGLPGTCIFLIFIVIEIMTRRKSTLWFHPPKRKSFSTKG